MKILRNQIFKVKSSIPEVQHALRRPLAAHHVQQIAIRGLITDRIVAKRRWQALTWSGAGYVLFAVIVEQISDIQSRFVAQNVCDLAKELVVIVHLENRPQIFRLQSQ